MSTITDPVAIQKLLTREVVEALNELRGFCPEAVAAKRRKPGNGAGRKHKEAAATAERAAAMLQ